MSRIFLKKQFLLRPCPPKRGSAIFGFLKAGLCNTPYQNNYWHPSKAMFGHNFNFNQGLKPGLELHLLASRVRGNDNALNILGFLISFFFLFCFVFVVSPKVRILLWPHKKAKPRQAGPKTKSKKK